MNPQTFDDDALDQLLSRMPVPDTDRVFDDAILQQYRAGALTGQDLSRAELLLIDSASARSVLAASSQPVDEKLYNRLEAVVAPEPRIGRSRERLGFIAVGLALAASIVGIVLRPTTTDFAPQYGFTDISGQVKDLRDGSLDTQAGQLHRYVADGNMKLLLRPVEGHSGGTPTARLYRVDGDGRMMAIEGAEIAATDGAGPIRVVGRAGDVLGEPPGQRRLFVVLGQADDPPELVGLAPDDARGKVCPSCWLVLDAEIVDPDGGDPAP